MKKTYLNIFEKEINEHENIKTILYNLFHNSGLVFLDNNEKKFQIKDINEDEISDELFEDLKNKLLKLINNLINKNVDFNVILNFDKIFDNDNKKINYNKTNEDFVYLKLWWFFNQLNNDEIFYLEQYFKNQNVIISYE